MLHGPQPVIPLWYAFAAGMGGATFEMQGGMGGMGEPVEAEPEHELDCDPAYTWIAGTTWNWNDWANVKFEADGKFTAPDKPCQEGRCSWRADSKAVYIQWGDRKRGEAGLHKVTAVSMVAEAGNRVRGQRKHDGDRVSATFVSKDETAEEDEEFYLYTLLGLDEDATEKQIKKAYHK
eukprot:SAG11_NODE_4266_length_1979_cov_1.548936_1_plen_178_part_00